MFKLIPSFTNKRSLFLFKRQTKVFPPWESGSKPTANWTRDCIQWRPQICIISSVFILTLVSAARHLHPFVNNFHFIFAKLYRNKNIPWWLFCNYNLPYLKESLQNLICWGAYFSKLWMTAKSTLNKSPAALERTRNFTDFTNYNITSWLIMSISESMQSYGAFPKALLSVYTVCSLVTQLNIDTHSHAGNIMC